MEAVKLLRNGMGMRHKEDIVMPFFAGSTMMVRQELEEERPNEPYLRMGKKYYAEVRLSVAMNLSDAELRDSELDAFNRVQEKALRMFIRGLYGETLHKLYGIQSELYSIGVREGRPVDSINALIEEIEGEL